MRKFFAFLGVLMILAGALAALPALAAEESRASKFDGTTTEATIDLVITEILVNSSTGHPELDNVVDEGDATANVYARDAFDYIEIYNRGTMAVNLYDYAIVSAVAKNFDWTNKLSETTGKFTGKVVLKEGNVLTGDDVPADAASGNAFTACYNPPSFEAVLMPGEFAVIWFYNKDTDRLAAKLQEAIGPTSSGDPFTKFINHYNMPADTKVFAVCGKTGTLANGQTAATFGLASGYTYALVEKNIDIYQKVIDNPWSKDKTNVAPSLTVQGQKILCMADYRTGTAVGILSTDNMDDKSAYYVPAACMPDLLIQNQLNALVTDAEKQAYLVTAPKDYVEAAYTNTYRGTAIVTFMEDPSPGTMPAWQWMYVDSVGESGTTDGVDWEHGLEMLETVAATSAETYEATMRNLVTDWATNTVIKDTDGTLNTADANLDNESDWVVLCLNDFLTTKAQPAPPPNAIESITTSKVGSVTTITIQFTDPDMEDIVFTIEDGAKGDEGDDGVTPQLRINTTTNEWEVSYDNGTNWTSLHVKATGGKGDEGNCGATPQLRINTITNVWEVSYDNGITWTSLNVKAIGEKGEQGNDGATPQLRINTITNVWEVSYDNGMTWTSLNVKATGEKGEKVDTGADDENSSNGLAIAAISVGSVSAVGVIGVIISSLLKRKRLL